MKENRITGSVILALTTLISAFIWIGLRDFLFEKGGFILPLIWLFIVCVLLSLGCLLLKSKIILMTTLFIVLFGFIIAFGFTPSYIIVALIALMFFYLGSCQSINEKKLRIKIKISKILEAGMPLIFTGLALLISVSYYFSPMSVKQFEIPRPLFDTIMKIIPLPSEQTAQIITTMPISSVEKQKDFLYELISQNINNFIEPYEEYLSIGLAISLFFILKTLSVPFMWLVIFVSWLIFKLLVFAKAIHVHEKSVLQEVIES
ncbi:hypothetical protein ACFLZ0_00480 [Patescibacteria group bacterium]